MLRSLPDYLERVVKAWWAILPGLALTGMGAYEYLAPKGAPLIVVSHQQAVVGAIFGALIAPFGAYWSLLKENRGLSQSATAMQRVTGTRSRTGAVKIEIEGPHSEADISAMERVSAPIRTDTFAMPPMQGQDKPQTVYYGETAQPLDFTIPARTEAVTLAIQPSVRQRRPRSLRTGVGEPEERS